MANEIDERLNELRRGGPAGRQDDEMDAAVEEDLAPGAAGEATPDDEGADAYAGVSAMVVTPGAEEASERAFGEGEREVPSGGLLSFYDRLRERILDTVEGRGGRLGPAGVRALLLVPDVFILLVRLAMDKDVPAGARAMIGGAIAYFVLPMDLFPEAIVGGAGYIDDLVLASAVLAHAFSGELEPYARKHWSGPEDVRKVLRDIAGAAQGLLGENLYDRLRKMLSKRGIDLDAQQQG
ncbi:MAG TPA: DUF1232 domain-containing protein [Thermoanaerobaculia bacterium]|nr:DUF1232 domain-containing protein [Thermoanaerobaculia bacterium]